MRKLVNLCVLSIALSGLVGCKSCMDGFVESLIDSAIDSNSSSRFSTPDMPESYRKRFAAQAQQDQFLRSVDSRP